ncbi:MULTISPECIES: hypothetical protein [Ralstonia]|jgi:hypothetical protein|uniref:Uncharacterized protein n=2 Tax=Ralstonia pickettii TaxID=329 RepID=R0E7F1_RALPI|nr:hypothetical protein [Ralstonia pickettii]ENZ78064.1 hypothetical protein OR214_02340 [Ralstonia pickettii OR214]MCM3581848.1 hypothetical protein [Ralstonia pickettii]
MTEQNTNSPLGDRIVAVDKDRRIVIVDEARYLSAVDKPLSLNVAKDFRNDEVRDFLMELLEQMANHKLSAEQRCLAVATGLRLPEGEISSLGTLVKVWLSEPTLREFAAALLYAALPGAQAELQNIEGLTIERSGAKAVISLNGKALCPPSGTA